MDKQQKGGKGLLTLILLVAFTVWVFLSFQAYQLNERQTDTLSYSQLLSEVETGNIKSVTINKETGELSGQFYQTNINGKIFFRCQISTELIERIVGKLENANKKPADIGFLGSAPFMTIFLTSYLPLIFLGIIGFFIFKRASGSGRGANNSFNLGKSRAKLFKPDKNKNITFSDVAGVNEAQEELQEIVEFLREPGKFQKLGGRIPKGVLLIGSPGTGKTLLARAVAGEAHVPFFSISGSDFVEVFAGVGASRVRSLFLQGKTNAPCIIFIDELDAVGGSRGSHGLSHEEREQTLNQILSEMDGFETNPGVIVIAATNRPEMLDPALLRPGRFDRQVIIDKPDIRGRTEILRIHTKKITLAEEGGLEIIARGTPGFSGADLANLVNEAALHAARNKKTSVDIKDLEWAKDKVIMGAERRSRVISPREKRLIAYHEAGHAIVTASLPENETDPLHKVTIIARGRSGGSTSQIPLEDTGIYGKRYLLNQLIILMGGRAAEDIALGECSTGAHNDIERATDITRSMVCEWGMTSLGRIKLGVTDSQPFLRRQTSEGFQKNYSEDTAQKIDTEMNKLLDTAYEQASDIISEQRPQLERIALDLMEYETLTGEQVKQILNPKES